MAYTTINKISDFFNALLLSGNGSDNRVISGVGFQPDFTWLKKRNSTGYHFLVDAVRGAPKTVFSNGTEAEVIQVNGLTAFNSDGFAVGSNSTINGNSDTFVSWNWLGANGTASNTDGTITSTVSANTTSGFSIVSYTGNATTGATIGHGLGVTPDVIIAKSRVSADSWGFFHSTFSSQQYMFLNSTSAVASASSVWNALPSSSVFTVGDNASVNDSGNMIAYCFAEKKGFSKFGSYTGNGNADGTFVYTGFKPAFVMVKQTNTTRYWSIFDNKRDGFNPTNRPLFPNASDQESDSVNYYHDILSNGFKWRTNATVMNESGGSYIYMAFAESPFVTGASAIPTTAR